MSQAQHSIPAGEPRLGIIAKSLHAPHPSGEIASAVADKKTRFKLQRKAQSILFNHQAEHPREQFRVCWCHRNLNNIEGMVGVFRKRNGSGARFSNIGTCGSVWHCPVCAVKISEQRRKELQRAMVVWATCKCGNAYLLTLTFPHTDGDTLADNLTKLEKAVDTFKNSRTYKNTKQRYGIAGVITSREVTWGTNGWHPHLHMLVFAGTGMDSDRRTLFMLKSAWLRACKKHCLLDRASRLKNMRDFWKHALDLRGGEKAAEYIAKFGRDERWGVSCAFHAIRPPIPATSGH